MRVSGLGEVMTFPRMWEYWGGRGNRGFWRIKGGEQGGTLGGWGLKILGGGGKIQG